jgi:hypothetical protein
MKELSEQGLRNAIKELIMALEEEFTGKSDV